MRKKVIAGNWKMNMLPNEAIAFIEEFTPLVKDSENEVVLCVPYTDLFYSLLTAQNTNIKIGAQNMHWKESGAYTGEIAPKMLKSIGVEYVIIGHSERRQYFNETNEACNKKVLKALEVGINPILCCGETLEQREANETKNICKVQVEEALKDVDVNDISKVVIAYEPIWAIGTGKTATSEDANDVISYIREVVAGLYKDKANEVRIQYGGSVKPQNVAEIMAQSDIDGALVGGASLAANDYIQLVNY